MLADVIGFERFTSSGCAVRAPGERCFQEPRGGNLPRLNALRPRERAFVTAQSLHHVSIEGNKQFRNSNRVPIAFPPMARAIPRLQHRRNCRRFIPALTFVLEPKDSRREGFADFRFRVPHATDASGASYLSICSSQSPEYVTM